MLRMPAVNVVSERVCPIHSDAEQALSCHRDNGEISGSRTQIAMPDPLGGLVELFQAMAQLQEDGEGVLLNLASDIYRRRGLLLSAFAKLYGTGSLNAAESAELRAYERSAESQLTE